MLNLPTFPTTLLLFTWWVPPFGKLGRYASSVLPRTEALCYPPSLWPSSVTRRFRELIDLSRTVEFAGMPAARHPYVRQKLAHFATEALCLRLSRYRSLTAQLNGRVPGPESSFGKLHATELNLRVAMFADELLGPYAQLERGSPAAIESGRWPYRALRARGLTIAAGSSEIQHNIIGERVLKLPKG